MISPLHLFSLKKEHFFGLGSDLAETLGRRIVRFAIMAKNRLGPKEFLDRINCQKRDWGDYSRRRLCRIVYRH